MCSAASTSGKNGSWVVSRRQPAVVPDLLQLLRRPRDLRPVSPIGIPPSTFMAGSVRGHRRGRWSTFPASAVNLRGCGFMHPEEEVAVAPEAEETRVGDPTERSEGAGAPPPGGARRDEVPTPGRSHAVRGNVTPRRYPATHGPSAPLLAVAELDLVSSRSARSRSGSPTSTVSRSRPPRGRQGHARAPGARAADVPAGRRPDGRRCAGRPRPRRWPSWPTIPSSPGSSSPTTTGRCSTSTPRQLRRSGTSGSRTRRPSPRSASS